MEISYWPSVALGGSEDTQNSGCCSLDSRLVVIVRDLLRFLF